jgi:hypothetical protein
VSPIFPLRIDGDVLVLDGPPLEVAMEDCYWRLTGLAWWGERLIALKTQFPGERYEVIEIDLETGEYDVLLNITSIMVQLGDRGWSNNIEGIAVTEDGTLWLVSDNSVTLTIDEPWPPPGEDRTLLMRIPRTE